MIAKEVQASSFHRQTAFAGKQLLYFH